MGVPRYWRNDDFPGGVLGRFESSTSSNGESVSLICFFKFSYGEEDEYAIEEEVISASVGFPCVVVGGRGVLWERLREVKSRSSGLWLTSTSWWSWPSWWSSSDDWFSYEPDAVSVRLVAESPSVAVGSSSCTVVSSFGFSS